MAKETIKSHQRVVTVYTDLDGPILDVAQRHHRAYAGILDDLGWTALEAEAYWELKRRKVSVEDILAKTEAGIPPDEFRRRLIEQVEDKELLKLDRLVPGSRDALEGLRGSFRIILVTLRHSCEDLSWQIAELGIGDLFDEVFCHGGADGSWEVKASMIRRDPWFSPERSVAVGDTEVDILAGKHLGIPTIGVSCGIRAEELLIEAGADRIIQHLGELRGALEGLIR